jgi:hypothetical protein
MPFDDFVNERGGVKSSPTKEPNNLMKIEDARTLEH